MKTRQTKKQFVLHRPLKEICGFTHEIIVGLVVNLESRRIRAMEYQVTCTQPKHPRSSSTDNVESSITLLHQMLGPVFDLKEFHGELPKLLNEYKERIDADLTFFYWIGSKTCYKDF